MKLDGIDYFDNAVYKITDVSSKGKSLWFKLENTDDGTIVYMMSSFGIKGKWCFQSSASSRIKFNIFNENNNKKYNFYYDDSIGYGILKIVSQKDFKKSIDGLAIDLLCDDYTQDYFVNTFRQFVKARKTRENMTIIKLLMEQNKSTGIGCGLGNKYSVEVLNRAGISPWRKLRSLKEAEIRVLCDSIKYIMKFGYTHNETKYVKHIEEFMKQHAENIIKGKYPNYHPDVVIDKKFRLNVYEKNTDQFGNEVTADKEVNPKRTTYWVKATQK